MFVMLNEKFTVKYQLCTYYMLNFESKIKYLNENKRRELISIHFIS